MTTDIIINRKHTKFYEWGAHFFQPSLLQLSFCAHTSPHIQQRLHIISAFTLYDWLVLFNSFLGWPKKAINSVETLITEINRNIFPLTKWHEGQQETTKRFHAPIMTTNTDTTIKVSWNCSKSFAIENFVRKTPI